MKIRNTTKKSNKILILMIVIILFNTFCPKQVQANDLGLRLKYGALEIMYAIPNGLINLLNTIFVDEEVQKNYQDSNGKDEILLSPETIIKGKFALMEANIFKKVSTTSGEYYDVSSEDKNGGIIKGKNALRDSISGWYYGLRNVAIVALLSVLVYIGIRMMMTSISQEKAKYKVMIKDWLVAICLVFAMHFIMVGVLNLSSTITSALGTGGSINMTASLKEHIETNFKEIEKIIDKLGTSDEDKTNANDAITDNVGYILIYYAVAIFTGIFVVKYIIRAITIIFLALIAPITCITYPIDKVKDGKAQAFEFWFREFFFQVIIQPFHLLIYIVLIGAAMDLASENIIYCILCYAMMISAEKIIKQMFGINDKLGSPLGTFASGALASQAMRAITSRLNSKNNKQGNRDNPEEEDTNLPPNERGSLGSYDDPNTPDSANTLPSGTEDNTENEPEAGNSNQQTQLSASQDEDTDDSEGNNEAIDYERANAFRNYRQQGLSQDEAEARVNEELPFNRNQENDNNTSSSTESSIESDPYTVNYGSDNTEPLDQPDETETSNNERQLDNNSQRNAGNRKELSKLRRGGRALKSTVAKDVRKKYGTTKFWKVAGKMAGNAGKKIAGTAVRGTLAATTAAAAGAFALATGNPKAVMAAVAGGAALGNSVGRRINGVASTVGSYANRYTRSFRSGYKGEDAKRKRAKENYIQNQAERDYVSQRLAEKNNGIEPSRPEIDAEMNKRWELKEQGIDNNSLIDSALDFEEEKRDAYIANNKSDSYDNVQDRLENDKKYRKDYEAYNNGELTEQYFNDTYGENAAQEAKEHYDVNEKATETAHNQTSYAARLANEYSKADFRDEKKMASLQKAMINEYREQTGAHVDDATRIVNNSIVDAAKIRGVKNPNIPGVEMNQSTTSRQNRRNTQQRQRPVQNAQTENTTSTISGSLTTSNSTPTARGQRERQESPIRTVENNSRRRNTRPDNSTESTTTQSGGTFTV